MNRAVADIPQDSREVLECVAALQDLLIHTLKGLSVAADAGRKVGVLDADVDRFVCMALFSTLTNVDFDPDRFEDLIVASVGFRDTMIKHVTKAGGKVDLSHDAQVVRIAMMDYIVGRI